MFVLISQQLGTCRFNPEGGHGDLGPEEGPLSLSKWFSFCGYINLILIFYYVRPIAGDIVSEAHVAPVGAGVLTTSQLSSSLASTSTSTVRFLPFFLLNFLFLVPVGNVGWN